MTIEPMMFVNVLALGISQVSIDQMQVYKICRGLIFNRKVWDLLHFYHSEEKFNLTVEFCEDIENNTEDPAYAGVEKEVQYTNISEIIKIKLFPISVGCEFHKYFDHDNQFYPNSSLILHRQLEW